MPTVARSAKVGHPCRICLSCHLLVEQASPESTARSICREALGTPLESCVASYAPHDNPKRTVYVLRSVPNRTRYYTGVTSDWRARLDAHNSGKCPHTASGRPWIVDVVVEFTDERRAVTFERYLKSGSGWRSRCAISDDEVKVRTAGEPPRPQDSQRTKARSGKSGCARCCGVVLGTRPDSTACTR